MAAAVPGFSDASLQGCYVIPQLPGFHRERPSSHCSALSTIHHQRLRLGSIEANTSFSLFLVLAER